MVVTMPVVPMVIVTATIAVCQTIEESIAVTISVSSVSSSVSSVVMIGGIVSTVMSTVTSVEVTHIVPGGEEWSELRITCITFCILLSYFEHFQANSIGDIGYTYWKYLGYPG